MEFIGILWEFLEIPSPRIFRFYAVSSSTLLVCCPLSWILSTFYHFPRLCPLLDLDPAWYRSCYKGNHCPGQFLCWIMFHHGRFLSFLMFHSNKCPVWQRVNRIAGCGVIGQYLLPPRCYNAQKDRCRRQRLSARRTPSLWWLGGNKAELLPWWESLMSLWVRRNYRGQLCPGHLVASWSRDVPR